MAIGLQKDYEPSELSTIGPGLLILRVVQHSLGNNVYKLV